MASAAGDAPPTTAGYFAIPGGGGQILHERARHYDGAGSGWLSVKSFHGGRAHYTVGRGRYAVDDACYLVLNQGQAYTIAIDAPRPVESLCIFLAPGFAEACLRDLTTSANRLLDDPWALPAAPVWFAERTYPHDTRASPALARLRAALRRGGVTPGWLEDWSHDLATRLLLAREDVIRTIAALPAARAATRVETYRRAHLARDYAAAAFDQQLTLADLGHVAGLSTNQLLRAFRQVFGQTPHQYLTTLRLEHARALLRDTDTPVTAIGLAVGFQSPGSFSWLFHRHYGESPTTYRHRFR